MPQTHLLAVDQGTTGTTVLVVNRRGHVVGRGYREITQYYPKPGWVEHDPQQIVRASLEAVRQALAVARISPRRLAGIGLTNQRETTVLWRRATSRPVHRAIVWQCRRTAPMCEALKRRGVEPRVRRATGLVLDAYFSGTKIRWLLDAQPTLRREAASGALAFGTMDTWLLWCLTGGRAHATDYTNASRTLLYHIHARRWDATLLRTFGVPASLLPSVQPSSGLFGQTVAVGPLPAGIPILGIAGDQQAALVGHGCVAPGTAKNTYGTGCFLLMNLGNRGVASRHGLITTLACGPRGEPVFALEGSVFIAGAAVQWLRDGLRVITRAAETGPIAQRVPDTGGVYVVPAFVGLGAPYWDMQARGAVLGITRGTTREVLVRATLEAIAYQTRDLLDAMAADTDRRITELQVDGGAAQNDWLMQFQADILGMPVVRPPLVENTAVGAARLAGATLGWWRLDAPMTERGRSRRFTPRMSEAQRRALYAGWQAAVARVRSR